MNPAPVYVRVFHGKRDFSVDTMRKVNPSRWSNKKQSVKLYLETDRTEKELTKALHDLRQYISDEYRTFSGPVSKEWFQGVVDKFNNKGTADAKNLNDYISLFIKAAESGERKNYQGMFISPGTIKGWKSFQRIFNEYQGIYTDKRLAWLEEKGKAPRRRKIIDFDKIDIDFYHSFLNFLDDEGYKRGTKGRFIKTLKLFMKKSLEDRIHNNREFEHSAFKGFGSKSFSIYLTVTELDKIYNIDLSKHPELDIARDAFMVLAETALRVSDYPKVALNIRKSEDGTKLLHITQTKTGGDVVIPLSDRLEAILGKYKGSLPRILDIYINKRIKTVAYLCGIDEEIRYEDEKSGKTFETHKKKYQLVSCHTARRSAATNMYLAGIPTLAIMSLTGHKTEAQFLKYIRVTPEENALKLAQHPYFRKSSLEIV